MHKYWSPMFSAWFPKGLEEPELRLIEVEAESAQYRDSTSSSMRYLSEVAAANLTGKEPDLARARSSSCTGTGEAGLAAPSVPPASTQLLTMLPPFGWRTWPVM